MSRGITDPAMDVCVICAVPVETRAFLAALTQEGAGPIKQGFSTDKWEYRHTTIQNNAGERLNVLITWLPRYGGLEMGRYVDTFVREFRPHFAAMTGICAGDRREVYLGDLIVAERAFIYDGGKFTEGKGGKSQHQSDPYTPHPSAQIVGYTRLFDAWKTSVASVKRPSSETNPARGLPIDHVATLASGNAVRADNPFALIQMAVRKAIALDMEGAAFYRTMEDFPQIGSLIVKGVSDYADGTKDDSYQEYAATVSALYMLAFIKEYVNARLMPGVGRAAPAPKPPERVKVVSTLARDDAALLPKQEPERQAAKKPSGTLSLLFIYAPEDKDFYLELKKNLSVLIRLGVIDVLQEAQAGDLVRQSVQQKLHEADVILLLITPALFTSNDLYEQQLEPAWQQRTRGAIVIPVYVKPVPFLEDTKYDAIEPLPHNRKPITMWSRRDDAYYEIINDFKVVVKNWNKPA